MGGGIHVHLFMVEDKLRCHINAAGQYPFVFCIYSLYNDSIN